MLNTKSLSVLVILIIIFSAVATTFGIFTHDGDGNYSHDTIRGKTITIYGTGIYKHMSNDVAIQGIAQDYLTLFAAIPLLIIGLIGTLKKIPEMAIGIVRNTGIFLRDLSLLSGYGHV